MKVKIYTIISIILYHIIFVNIAYLQLYNIITYIFMFFVAIFLLYKVKIVFKENLKINIVMSLFCIIICISSLYNVLNFHRGIIYASKIFETFLVFEFLKKIDVVKKVMKIYVILSIIYCLLNDFISIIFPELFLKHDSNYFLGDKFTVAYMHIMLIVFYISYKGLKKSKYNKVIYMFIFWSIMASIFVDCSTALIGNILLILLFIIPDRVKVKIFNIKILLLLLLISGTFWITYKSLLNNSYVSDFITGTLNRSLTLTGRTVIYENVWSVISKKIWLGYGLGNSYELLMKLIAASNTQNGFLESMFQYGALGTIMSAILIIIVVKMFENANKKILAYPILMCIYIFLILSSIEITINICFWGMVAILVSYSDINKQKEEK